MPLEILRILIFLNFLKIFIFCPIRKILSDYKIAFKTESTGFFKLRKVTHNRSQTSKNLYRENFLKIGFSALIFDCDARF